MFGTFFLRIRASAPVPPRYNLRSLQFFFIMPAYQFQLVALLCNSHPVAPAQSRHSDSMFASASLQLGVPLNSIRVHHGSALAPAKAYEIHFAVPWKYNISSSRQRSTYISRSSSIAILADPPIRFLDHRRTGTCKMGYSSRSSAIPIRVHHQAAPARNSIRVPLQLQF